MTRFDAPAYSPSPWLRTAPRSYDRWCCDGDVMSNVTDRIMIVQRHTPDHWADRVATMQREAELLSLAYRQAARIAPMTVM